MPKTAEEIQAEDKKLRRKEAKKQTSISADTKFPHRYMFVATSLPGAFAAEEILKAYRLRWQVEMVFKRYKSILGLGSIPTKTKESTEAWLNGKMLLALLIEKFLGDADFSPSGRSCETQEHLEGDGIGFAIDFNGYHAKRKSAVRARFSGFFRLLFCRETQARTIADACVRSKLVHMGCFPLRGRNSLCEFLGDIAHRKDDFSFIAIPQIIKFTTRL